MGLRANQRETLVTKINESCTKAMKQSRGLGDDALVTPYLNASEMELIVATKGRSSSVDHVGAKRRLQSASRASKKPDNHKSNALLPSIAAA